jgi:hypothetical protein
MRYVGKIYKGEKFEGTIFRTTFGWFTATHNCFKPIATVRRGPIDGYHVEYDGKRFKMNVLKWYDDMMMVDLDCDATVRPSLANWPKLSVWVYKPEVHQGHTCLAGYWDSNGTPIAAVTPGRIIEVLRNEAKHTCWSDFGMSGSPVIYGTAYHVVGLHVQGGPKDAQGIAPWNVFKPFTEELRSAFGDSRIVGEITISEPSVETSLTASSYYRGYEEPYIEEEDLDFISSKIDEWREKYGDREDVRRITREFADLEDDFYNQEMNNQERLEFEQRVLRWEEEMLYAMGVNEFQKNSDEAGKVTRPSHRALIARNMAVLRAFKEIYGIPHVDRTVKPKKENVPTKKKVSLKSINWSDLVAHPGSKKLTPTMPSPKPAKKVESESGTEIVLKKSKSPDVQATLEKQVVKEKSKPRVPDTDRRTEGVNEELYSKIWESMAEQQRAMKALAATVEKIQYHQEVKTESAAPAKEKKKPKQSNPLKLAKRKLIQTVKAGKDHAQARENYIAAVMKKEESIAEKKADKIESAVALLETARKQADAIVSKTRPKPRPVGKEGASQDGSGKAK